MKKLIIALLTLLLLVGCGGEAPARETAAESETGAVTIVDDLGRSVTVDYPQRVAALIGSFADVWCLAGGGGGQPGGNCP